MLEEYHERKENFTNLVCRFSDHDGSARIAIDNLDKFGTENTENRPLSSSFCRGQK